MASNFEQNRSIGRILPDLSAQHVSTQSIRTKNLMAVESVDQIVVEIENDITDLNQVVDEQQNQINELNHDVSVVEQVVLNMNTVQSWPWWSNVNIEYGQVQAINWLPSSNIPDAASGEFQRTVILPKTFSALIVVLPLAVLTPDIRHASIFLGQEHVAVMITTNVQNTIRLSALKTEWFPDGTGTREIQMGYGTLYQRPSGTFQYVFGTDDNTSGGAAQCVVFPGAGEMYVKSLYLDSSNPAQQQLVLVGEKFASTTNNFLTGIEYYGIL